MTIGERIKLLRKKNDLTQEKLADYLGVSYQAVSKWECGASSPDLSLIVPLAKLLHVTTDELLGMVDAETDERKTEYDALYEKPHYPEQLEIAQKAARDFPGELKYIAWQADCLFLLAYDNYSTQEKFYEDLEKSLKLYLIVFENAVDNKLKNSVLPSIVQNLSVLRRNDEAVKYAELYVSTPTLDKDTVMGWALTGEQKNKHSQEMLMKHLNSMLQILINKKDPDNSNLMESDHLECAETIIRLMFPSGEYNHYYEDLFMIHIFKAQNFADHDPEKAVEALKQARLCAKYYDNQFVNAPSELPYHSPYFDLLSFDSSNPLLVYGPLTENKLIDHFEWWLSAVHFDTLRERSDFQSLLNN